MMSGVQLLDVMMWDFFFFLPARNRQSVVESNSEPAEGSDHDLSLDMAMPVGQIHGGGARKPEETFPPRSKYGSNPSCEIVK